MRERGVTYLDDGYGRSPHMQRIATTGSLRNDLPEDDDDHSGRHEAHNASGVVRKDDGQERVHGHVAEEQRAEEQVAVLAHRNDLICEIGEFGIALLHDLQPVLVEAEETEREPGEEPRHHDQHDDEEVGEQGGGHGEGPAVVSVIPTVTVLGCRGLTLPCKEAKN